MLRLLAVVCLLALLSACESNDPKVLAMKPADLVEFTPTAKLQKIWSSSAGAGQDTRYSRFELSLSDNRLFAADTKGRVYAFDAESGKKLWSVDLDISVSAAIGSDGDRLLLGTYNGTLHALDINTGEQLWQVKVSSEVAATPAGNGDIVVATTVDGVVYALEASTGAVRWSYDHTVPILSLRGSGSPALTASQVIVPFDNGQLVSMSSSDGSTQWEARIGRPQGRTELERIVDIDGTPIVDGSFIYAATYQGSIMALTRGAGRTQWSKDMSTTQNIALASGKLFVSGDDSTVTAFSAMGGETLWENSALKRRNIGAPAGIDDYVAVIDADGYLHLLQQSDGAFAYRFKPRGDTFRSPMLSANGSLYILADNGKLTAYKVASKP
ncbi:outer membrane protein assembly factor BamB [Teredinibacter waterburyi]|jgi:outer membrane assembly lipoprotein YfgL|uniref:outer membrane protein assembly factor BamB n=1 Tax=Teredinibacter waterburyi TaxID=1500538 RepID=UPI00165F247B|nr:outer membrane protein assembly factor BamB [Teredinibacter waterburyi]